MTFCSATHAGPPQPGIAKVHSTANRSAVIILNDTVCADGGNEYTLLNNDTEEVPLQLQTAYIYKVPAFDVEYAARVRVTDQCSQTRVTEAQNFIIAGKQTDSRKCYSHVCAKRVGVSESSRGDNTYDRTAVCTSGQWPSNV